jgi:hypothetical protein
MKTAEDWLAKYYPIPAGNVPKAEAGKACLLKWQGCRRATLKQYGLCIEFASVRDAGNSSLVLFLRDDTCAYCIHYREDEPSCHACHACPLATVRKGVPCDKCGRNEKEPPWERAAYGGVVGPLIRWLEKAVAYEQRQAKKKRAKKR